MISGFNHFTLAVSDLEVSFRFYTEVLGLRPVARWFKGAHLLAGSGWLCLALDNSSDRSLRADYTHVAFTVHQTDFRVMEQRLMEEGVTLWQPNHSEGDSLYFLDPDGHKLEIHASDLAARIEALRSTRPKDLFVFEENLAEE